jgi:hypothetical protein
MNLHLTDGLPFKIQQLSCAPHALSFPDTDFCRQRAYVYVFYVILETATDHFPKVFVLQTVFCLL